MARMHWIGVAALGLLLTGCVSQEKYNAMKLDRDQAQAQLAAAQNDLSAARAEADAYKRQIEAMAKDGPASAGLIKNLTDQNSELQKQIADLREQYAKALAMQGQGVGPLPADVRDALMAFARENPDLVEFDAARGIVKFKSDVTFALGSADLTPQAKQVIDRFAQILGSSASSFELLVAGHTDNLPVSNPATIAKGHKDNWYLSAHRAIAVAKELIGQRINANRLGVAGYADQRPVASNASDSGRSQNRRVEVLILPAKGASNVAGSTPKVAPLKPVLNKDSGPKDTAHPQPPKPMFNK